MADPASLYHFAETADAVAATTKRPKSGYALRFPCIVRLREDKLAGEISTLEDVRRLAAPVADASSQP